MAKTYSYRIINNRVHFKCPVCGTRKYIAAQRDLRRRSIRCHKCGERTACIFNRRDNPRDNQTGKAILILHNGNEIEIDLHDISMKGIGFDLPVGTARKLSVRQIISFKCSWNPRLIGNARYIVRSIKGRRVGAEKVS